MSCTVKKVIESKQKMISLEIYACSPGQKTFLVERNYVKNEMGAVLLFTCMDVTNTRYFNQYQALSVKDIKLLGKNSRPFIYILNGEYSSLKLTENQEICLFLLIRGKTTKEIAKILSLGPRTIEDRVTAIKNRMNCQYKSEVIEKAIDMGFLYYIPKSIQNRRILNK